MIDDKKIEAAKEEIYEDKFLGCGEMVEAFKYEDAKEMFDKEDIKEAIGLGTKWAINEFIKDLWHTDENPKKYHKCLLEVVYHIPLNMTDEIDYVTSHLTNFGWDESSFKRSDYTINRWIYIDDLLKGCNHD